MQPPQTPPPITPGTPQYGFGSPPPPPARKPPIGAILAGLAATVIGAAVVFGGLRQAPKFIDSVRPSGLKTNGQSLSRAEVREGLAEMAAMSRGAKAGDPSTLNMGTEPKTEMGKNFKRLALKSQGVESAYLTALKGGTVDDVLAPERLTSKAGRAKSKTELAFIRKASKTYFDDTKGVTQELFRLIATDDGKQIPQAAKLAAEVDTSATSMMKILDIAEEILAFAERTKPTAQGSTPVFRTSADVARFNTLADSFTREGQNFQRHLAASLRSRQESMNNSISKIDSGEL